MNTFDIVIAVIVLFGFIRGALKGLFVEVASLTALIAGIYGAIHFSFLVRDLLADQVSWDDKYLGIAAFAITFGLIVVVISLLGKLLTKIADFAALGSLNKLLGGLFGGLKMGVILSVLLLVFSKINNLLGISKLIINPK
ncbi:MAG: CvpA family protein [Lutibacter sp.]|nr:CvpA family protein [Lutibacter sp.]